MDIGTKKRRVIIVGATGYGGAGLLDIISGHPGFEVVQVVARQDVGVALDSIFPHLKGRFNLQICSIDEIDYNADLVFFSTPDRVGMSIVRSFFERGIKVIDFSGDFRFKNTNDYAVYAQNRGISASHLACDLLDIAVFGLPELYSTDLTELKNARIVGNTGCMSCSIVLGLLPVFAGNLNFSKNVMSFGVTGVSGAGRLPGKDHYFAARYEDVNSYRVCSHQHYVESEMALNSILSAGSSGCSFTSGCDRLAKISFVPSVGPFCRGILVTSFVSCYDNMSQELLYKLYNDYYATSPFVQISNQAPHTSWVKGTNNCIIHPLWDARNSVIVTTSVIDNLVKGQSGNAVQCANIMCDYPQDLGLPVVAQFP